MSDVRLRWYEEVGSQVASVPARRRRLIAAGAVVPVLWAIDRSEWMPDPHRRLEPYLWGHGIADDDCRHELHVLACHRIRPTGGAWETVAARQVAEALVLCSGRIWSDATPSTEALGDICDFTLTAAGNLLLPGLQSDDQWDEMEVFRRYLSGVNNLLRSTELPDAEALQRSREAAEEWGRILSRSASEGGWRQAL